MKLAEAKMEFIQTWGALGSAWGIPRSMAQIHALLLSSNQELSAEEIMETIRLSRGNVNINLRELSNWKLVSKQNKLGERKEFFVANQDIWNVARNIVNERKKRELQPIQDFLEKFKHEKLTGDEAEIVHFNQLIDDLDKFVREIDKLSELMVRMNDNKFFKKLFKTLS